MLAFTFQLRPFGAGALVLSASLCLVSPLAYSGGIVRAIKPEDTISRCAQPDRTLGYRFRAHCTEQIVQAGHRSEMKFNSQGLRDRDYSPKPSVGWTRLLFIGPSSITAPGLSEKESPPRKLEAKLKKHRKKLEVINAGVQGYSPLNFNAAAKGWLEAYSPSHTMLFLSMGSAIATDLLSAPYATWDQQGHAILKVGVFPGLKTALSWFGVRTEEASGYKLAFTLQNMGYRALHSLRCSLQNRKKIELSRCMSMYTIISILNLKKLVENSGSKFLLVTNTSPFTNEVNLSPMYNYEIARWIDKMTPTVNMSGQDMIEILRSHAVNVHPYNIPNDPKLRLPQDYHLSAAGSERLSEDLFQPVQSFLKD
jgi:hypothetical protein